MNVPLFDGAREFDAHADEYLAAAERVLRSGRYILGPEVEAFEQGAAAYLGAQHAIGCASGTDALWLALRAAGIRPGDGVITTAMTFFATASSILNVGAMLVLCDIDEDTLNLDPESARRVLADDSEPHARLGIESSRIRAILPVHLYGQPADMDELADLAQQYDLMLIEDAAQAFGATYSDRKAGTADDSELAGNLRMLRNHGGRSKFENVIVGTNSRLDALQAAPLRVRLEHTDEAIEGRRRVADAYDEALEEVDLRLPVRAPGRTHTFAFYTVRTDNRDQVLDAMGSQNIGATSHNPRPVHLQPAVGLAYAEGDLARAEEACAQVISLPTFPTMRDDEAHAVSEALRAVLSNHASSNTT